MPTLDAYLTDTTNGAVVVPANTGYTISAGTITTTRANWTTLVAGSASGIQHSVGVNLASNGMNLDVNGSMKLRFVGFDFYDGINKLLTQDLAFWYCDFQFDPTHWSNQVTVKTVTITIAPGDVGTNPVVTRTGGASIAGPDVGSYLACNSAGLGDENSQRSPAPTISSVVGNTINLTGTYSLPTNSGTFTAYVGPSPATGVHTAPRTVMADATRSQRITFYGCDFHNSSSGMNIGDSTSLEFYGCKFYNFNEPYFDPTDRVHADAMSAQGADKTQKIYVNFCYIQGRVIYKDADPPGTTLATTTGSTTVSWKQVWHDQANLSGFQLSQFGDPTLGAGNFGVFGNPDHPGTHNLEDVWTWHYGPTGAARLERFRGSSPPGTDTSAPWNQSPTRINVTENTSLVAGSGGVSRLGRNSTDSPVTPGTELNHASNPANQYRAFVPFSSWPTVFSVGSAILSINPTGIPSANAFGLPKITMNILPTGIASVAAFGVPTVANAGSIVIHPTGIASVAAFGTPSINIAPPPNAAPISFANIIVGAGDLYVNDIYVGSSMEGCQISFNPETVDVDSDLFDDAAKVVIRKVTTFASTTLAEATLANMKLAFGRGGYSAASPSSLDIGVGGVYAPTYKITVVGNAPNNKTRTFTFWAGAVYESVEYKMARDSASVFAIKFKMIPDLTKSGKEYGTIVDS